MGSSSVHLQSAPRLQRRRLSSDVPSGLHGHQLPVGGAPHEQQTAIGVTPQPTPGRILSRLGSRYTREASSEGRSKRRPRRKRDPRLQRCPSTSHLPRCCRSSYTVPAADPSRDTPSEPGPDVHRHAPSDPPSPLSCSWSRSVCWRRLPLLLVSRRSSRLTALSSFRDTGCVEPVGS
jgi:hypothetical protein